MVEAWHCDGTVETVLHKYYQAQRMRGEWFKLTMGDILNIEEIFCDQLKFSTNNSQMDEDSREQIERDIEEDRNEILWEMIEMAYDQANYYYRSDQQEEYEREEYEREQQAFIEEEEAEFEEREWVY